MKRKVLKIQNEEEKFVLNDQIKVSGIFYQFSHESCIHKNRWNKLKFRHIKKVRVD